MNCTPQSKNTFRMITIQDLYNIIGNKIANETQKALFRNNFPPQIAEQMCNAIDEHETAEHFKRLLKGIRRVDAEPTASARGGTEVFEGVL